MLLLELLIKVVNSNDFVSNGSSNANRSKIIIGCTAGILSSACQSVGLILQRKSHIISQFSKNNHVKQPIYNRSLWHIGLFLFLFANIFGSSIQITSLPLLVLSPLQSVGLVFNTIFHTIMLDEPFTLASMYGTILTSLGAFFTAFCGGSLTEPEYTLTQFVELLKNVNFLYWILIDIFIISCISTWIILINGELSKNLISNHLNNLILKLDEINFRLNTYDNSVCALTVMIYIEKYTLEVVRKSFFIYVHLLKHMFLYESATLKKIKGILFGIISGILSAFSLLLAKSSIEILITTFFNKDWKSLNDLTAYFIVISFILLGISQLYLLNKGLKNISTSVLYPLVFCIYNGVSISNSLIFFKQWSQLTAFTFTILIIGLLLVMTGVFLLSLQDIEQTDKQLSSSPISSSPSPMLINPTTKLISSPLQSKAKYYDSIGVKISKDSYRDNISEYGFESDSQSHNSSDSVNFIDNDSQNDDFNPNSKLSTSLSNSIGTIIHNTTTGMVSNSDIMAPFIKRTTENINNAGRKVSGFLKKSVDSIQNVNSPNIDPTTNTNNGSFLSSNTLNHTALNNNNNNRKNENSEHEIHEYVSFDSLQDMALSSVNHYNHSNNSSIIGANTSNYNLSSDYDSLLQENNNDHEITTIHPADGSNSTVSHGLNLLQPIIGKIKKQTSMLEIPQVYMGSNNNTQDTNDMNAKVPSSYKSSLSFSLKNFTSGDTNSINNNEIDISPRMKKKTSISRKLKSDEDYNPNNNFNYSFNNTLEEIQNQMVAYESSSAQIENTIPHQKLRQGQNNNITSSFDDDTDSFVNDKSFPIVNSTRILPRSFSAKYRGIDNNKTNENQKKNRAIRRLTLDDHSIAPNRGHRRVLSFEQNQLLNELKK